MVGVMVGVAAVDVSGGTSVGSIAAFSEQPITNDSVRISISRIMPLL